MLTLKQARCLRREYDRYGNLSRTASRMGVDRKTARKYIKEGVLVRGDKRREYRTRPDPFEQDWPEMERMLVLQPKLEAKTLLELWEERAPGRYHRGQLRTLQRRVRAYRAQHGPPKEVFFEQVHRAGERMQTDFTDGKHLQVTVLGEPLQHLLCHAVLPMSNLGHVTVCRSESLMALCRGIQSAVLSWGGVPQFCQTDNSTSATHHVKREGSRKFNPQYEAFCAHYGMVPSTIGVGKSEQNGDVEAANGALKRAISQALMVRGSSDFDSVADYEAFLSELCTRRNQTRANAAQELATLGALPAERWPEFRVYRARVGRGATVRVLANTYSVPSRLMGHKVDIRVFDERIEVYLGQALQMQVPRLLGKHQSHVDYRHVIWSLVQKPGAFARYKHREQLFPSAVFRRTLDTLRADEPNTRGDLAYLRILHLAAAVGESKVESALVRLLEDKQPVSLDALKRAVGTEQQVPAMQKLSVSLHAYDALLGAEKA